MAKQATAETVRLSDVEKISVSRFLGIQTAGLYSKGKKGRSKSVDISEIRNVSELRDLVQVFSKDP